MSQLEKVFEAIGPAGIVCKDLFAALEIPRHDIEQYLSVLLSSKRVTVLNGMYVQVPKYEDYYDARGRLKDGYEGVSDRHRERADGTVVEAIEEPPPRKPRPKKPVVVDDGPEQRTCVSCLMTFHRSFFPPPRILKCGTHARSKDCNRCKMRKEMARTAFGRWLLTQPESEWVRIRKQRKHDLKYKRDTLGIGIPPHHHKYEPDAAAEFQRQLQKAEERDQRFRVEPEPQPAVQTVRFGMTDDGRPYREDRDFVTGLWVRTPIEDTPETKQDSPGAAIDPDPPPQYGGAYSLTAELALYRGLLREVLYAPKGMQYLPYDLIERIKNALNDAPSQGTAVPQAPESA